MKAVSVMILTLFGSAAPLWGANPAGELLEFTAAWCTYCRDVAPVVKRLEREGLPIRQVDADRQPDELKRYGVAGLPTFVLVVNNKEVERVSGSVSEATLRRMLQKIPAASPAPTSSSGVTVELGESTTIPRPTPGQGVVATSASSQPAEDKGGFLGDFSKLYRRAPKAKPEVRGQDPAAFPVSNRDDQAHAASVRLQVVTADKRLLGSGTIIQSQPGRTLILTCGNLFTGAESAKIEVDFPDVPNQTFVGRLVKADQEADAGLVAINTDEPLPTAPIASRSAVPAVGDAVAGFGASEGKEVVREQVRVTALNKYSGLDNIECSGVPMQGRCGGGLFNAAGQLIGICIASGDVPNTGVYCGLLAVHDFLESCGLKPREETPPAAVAMDSSLNDGSIDLGSPGAFPEAPARALASANPPAALAAGTPKTPANVNNAFHQERVPSGSPDDEEIVVIVRNKHQPDAPSRVMVIHRASPKLKAMLKGELDGGLRTDGPTQYAAGRRVTPAGGSRIH